MRLPSFLLRNVGEKRSGDGDGLRNGAGHATDNLPEERVEDKESTKRWSWTSFRRRPGGQLGKGKRGNGDRLVTEDETSMRNNSKKWHWKAVAGTRTETENHGSTRTGVIGVGNGNATATAPTPASTSHPNTNASTGNNRVEVETLQEPGESEAARVEFEDDTAAHGLVYPSQASSPHSPPDLQKPLPLTPLQDVPEDASGHPSSQGYLEDQEPGEPIRLDSIMTALTEDDIEKLFSGAPQFFVRSEAYFPGAPHPSVAFPYDEELEIRDLSDHVQIEDKAWSGVTAWPHLTRDLNHDQAARNSLEKHVKAHFHVRARERPNMLSMQGLEKGTMGYQAALELAVGDSLEEEQFGFESVGTKAKAIIEARKRMLSTEGWLRRLPEHEIMHRLRRNGDTYRNNDLRKKPSVETYKDLFHSFMRPCATIIDKTDQHSLVNQINALVKCLATANVWIDLSRVEWRIRLGQILWGHSNGDELDDDTEIQDAANSEERNEERYWLLMQVLVSTELLVRLDAITEGDENGGDAFRPMDGVYFERQANNSVKWSIILAQSWLENLEVVQEETGDQTPVSTPASNGWLASLVSKMTMKYHEHELLSHKKHQFTIKGRHGSRQVDGLTHFARKIQWPGIDAYESRISEHAQTTAKSTPNTLLTPTTVNTSQSSYFGAWDVTSSHHHNHLKRVQAQRRKMAAALHSSGWLSKSYVFALMLPGEALSHFLMATLLENDLEAMDTLGSFANLCGGFVYRGKSFWSTSCIVGRVLAAGKGAAECMGWISTDVLPDDTQDGWLNIEVDDVRDDLARLGKKARIWGKKQVERESYILGDGDPQTVLPEDFIIPQENVYPTPPPLALVELKHFKLLRSVDTVHPSPLSEFTGTPMTESSKAPDLPSHPAKLIFTISIDGGRDEDIPVTLDYDISFVTAHPCSPSQRVRFVKSPGSPTIQQIDITGSQGLHASRSVYRAGHPLHKYFHYNVIHISELLQKRHSSLDDLLGTAPAPRSSGRFAANNRVLVIDCITNYAEIPVSPVLTRGESGSSAFSFPTVIKRRGSLPNKMHLECRRRQFGSDMEMLVRALCAQKGWNAVISRRKRGCLGCAIREAGALGWRVIIRVD